MKNSNIAGQHDYLNHQGHNNTGSNETNSGGVISDPLLGLDQVSVYSVDGTGNNLSSPTLGATGTDETRIAPPNSRQGPRILRWMAPIRGSSAT